jgi:hypothetical protein
MSSFIAWPWPANYISFRFVPNGLSVSGLRLCMHNIYVMELLFGHVLASSIIAFWFRTVYFYHRYHRIADINWSRVVAWIDLKHRRLVSKPRMNCWLQPRTLHDTYIDVSLLKLYSHPYMTVQAWTNFVRTVTAFTKCQQLVLKMLHWNLVQFELFDNVNGIWFGKLCEFYDGCNYNIH